MRPSQLGSQQVNFRNSRRASKIASTRGSSASASSRWGYCVAAWLISWVGILPALKADEPYERFLEKLRQEQLFDLALAYLNGLESTPGVSSKFKADVDLERGVLLYQAAAMLSPRSPIRIEKLDAAEAALRSFLQAKQNHPRRGEARLKLGELLLTRAEEAKAAAGNGPDMEAPEAAKFYEEAHQLFENTVTELAGILEQLKGNRVDPSDAEKVAYRQQVQQDIRQAQLLSAKSVEERGRSHGADSSEWQKDLEQALAMYSDLYSKEQRLVGIRNYALFYRSSIHATLGKTDDAIDGFQRIADLEGVDVLRPLQTNSVTELLPLLASQGKYQPALDRAEKWLAGLRPDERKSLETLSLQLALAKFRIGWAAELQAADPTDRIATRLTRDARAELRTMLRTTGPHLDEARELLAQLGVEAVAASTDEIPKVKDFSEAITEAQKRIDQAETDSIGVEILATRAADSSLAEDEQQAARSELAQLQQTIDSSREVALQLLRNGFQLFGADDDRSQLFEARFRVAFLLLKLNRPWDALVVGEFLCRTTPGTEQGLRAAAVSLSSFSSLLNEAGDDKSLVTAQLEPFAEYLVATWPQSPEAAAAAAALAQLSIIAKDWDKAERFLALVPETNESIGKQRRDLGISFYVEYLQALRAAGEDTEEIQAFRQRAMKWLQLGCSGLEADKLDTSVVDAFNALARLMLTDGRIEDAAQLMLDGDKALIKVLESKPDLATPKTAMESYRTAIQTVAAQLVAGSLDSEQAVSQMKAFIGRLQELAKATPDGEEKLSGISIALARDLKDKLATTKDATQRNRLSEAVLLVVGEAAKSDSFSTQYWAGNTKIALAEDLASQPTAKAAADRAFTEGADILKDILAKEQAHPGWIQPAAAKIQIQVALAKAQRGMGNHQAAVLSLGEILDDNNSLLDVQIEAAEALQAWGNVKPEFFKVAMIGGRKKNGKNVIWGWGKIAQITTNQANFTEQFYNARYQLASCRFRYAASLKNAEQKAAEMRRAEKDIVSTATLYPQLGGPAKKKEFDALLKQVQAALGEPATGLKLDNR